MVYADRVFPGSKPLNGIRKNNPLSKIVNLSLWVNSKAYNFIENTHQIWLLTVCDLIIGKREYPAKKKS